MFWPNHPSPCFKTEMVGPIKTLTDLRRIEAAVRVTCNECGYVRMLDREVLIAHRTLHGGVLDWSAVSRELPCWNSRCLSRNTRVDALPFSQDGTVMRRKRAETILMNLALTVLTDAAYRASTTPIDTSEVRLALRVLYPYLADQEPLLRFWSVAAMDRGPSDSCHPALHQIVAGLIERGHAVEAEFR